MLAGLQTTEQDSGTRALRPTGVTPNPASNHIVTMIIPILGVLLFLTLLMIVATVIYR